jgi:hypothetical protein
MSIEAYNASKLCKWEFIERKNSGEMLERVERPPEKWNKRSSTAGR